MQPEPQQQHHWLQQLTGSWTFESECNMGPDQPPGKFDGKIDTRSLGGLWIIGDGEGSMPGGGTSQTQITLGFDPQKNTFVGSFIASMMTHLWIYHHGVLDADEKVLTLDAEGPSFTGSGMAQYQDIITIVDANHHILTSRVQGDDGQWTHFMTAHYRRR